MARPNIIIYSGGRAKPSPDGPGGWAALLIRDGDVEEMSGHESSTTNVRMELMAAFMAFEALEEPSNVEFYTDSVYIKRGITLWLPKWVKNGWHTTNNQPMQNRDLWEGLHELIQQHDIRWKWLKRGLVKPTPFDNRVAELVTAAREHFTAPKLIELGADGLPKVDISIYLEAWYMGGPWGAVIVTKSDIEEVKGDETNTTGNQAVLIACAKLLERFTSPQRIAIYSSNDYLINGMSKWLRGWQKNDWTTTSGEPVKNQEQWKRLAVAAQTHTIIWIIPTSFDNPYIIGAINLIDIDFNNYELG